MFAFNPDDCIVKGAQAENDNANNVEQKDQDEPRTKLPMKLKAPGISSLSKSTGRGSSHLRASLNARKASSARSPVKTGGDIKQASSNTTNDTRKTPSLLDLAHSPIEIHSSQESNNNGNDTNAKEAALPIVAEEEIFRDSHPTPPSTTSNLFNTNSPLEAVVDSNNKHKPVTTEEKAPSPRGGVLTADGTTASLPAQSKEMIAATEAKGGIEEKIDINMVVKILVVGNAKCGKSSIITRYTSNAFDNEYKTTVGADFVKKDVLVEHPHAYLVNTSSDSNTNGSHNNKNDEDTLGPVGVRMHLWDIAGQDRFQKLTRPYFNKAKAVVIVCDISREGTIEAVLNWKKEIDLWIDKTQNRHLPVVLFANKSDLLKHSVSAIKTGAIMERMCREQNFLGWWITSARTGDTLQEAFYTLLQRVVQLEFEAQGLFVGGQSISIESSRTACSADSMSMKGVTAKRMGLDFQAKQREEQKERAAKGIFKLDARDYERERENSKYSEGVLDCC